MKQLLKALALLVVSAIVLASAVVAVKLDSILRSAIVGYGPQLTQTAVSVESISVSPLLGRATIKGLAVGNPKGFSPNDAFAADRIHAALDMHSLLSNTIIVPLVEVDGAKVNLEGRGAASNLNRIAANVNEFATQLQVKLGVKNQTKSASATPAKNVLIKLFVLKGAQATVRYGVITGKALTVKLPDLELRDLGTGGRSASPSAIIAQITKAIQESVVKAAAQPLKDLGNRVKGIGKGVKNQLRGLFGK